MAIVLQEYVISYLTRALFPPIGVINTIYIDDSLNQIYRWTGSTYVNIGEYPTVATYADLPPAADNNGKVYLVTTSTGVWPFNHPAGFYISNGVTWTQIPATAGAITYADLFASNPITYDGAGTYGLNWNTTNLKLTSTALNTIQDIDVGSSPQFTGLNLSGLTASYAVVTDASKNLASLQYTPSNVASTIMSRDSNGDFIARKANLTTLSVSGDGNIAGYTTLGTAGGVTLDQKLMIRGLTNDIAGPHWVAYTTSDPYPVFQHLNWAHNIIAQNFDCYWDAATWKSSSSSSNFQIYKFTNQCQFNYASSVAAGSTITWNTAGYIDLVTGTLIWNKQGKFNDTTDSTSISTGGLTTLGGLGVTKSVYIGGNLNVAGTITANGAALTKTDDTNVTLTLGGTPATALLKATSLTLGWTGQLSLARGGTNAALTASNGGIFYSTASAGAILAGTATTNQLLISGASAAPSWTSRYIDYGTGNVNTIGNLFAGNGCGNTGITQSIHSTAFGINALASIPTSGTTGSNTAFGYSAGTSLSNANAIYNTFIGSNAGFYLTTGGRNTLIGFSTANSGAFATQNNCTLLGSDATFSANNLSNAMALGYAASVGTDNTIVLGNSSVTRVTTSGSLGLGTTFVPQFKVEAVGGIASTDGATAISQKQMVMKYDTVNNRGDITCIHQGVAFKPILFQCDSVGITNGSVPGTPTGFYAIYVTSGALKGKGTSGTITNIGNADPHCKKCGSDFGLGWEHPRYGGQVRICEICRSEYDDNLRKCILYIANDNKAALADMQSFLSEEPSYIVWNVDRDDEYKNIRIPLDIGRQMADEIDAKEAAEKAAKSLMQAIA